MDRRVLAIALLGLAAREALADVSFTGLGFFPGANSTIVYAISADGSTVIGQSGSGSNQVPFYWTRGAGLTPFPSGFGAAALNADGAVFAGALANQHAGLWSVADGIQDLGIPFGQYQAGAFGISGDGTVVVGQTYSAVGSGPAFRWTSATGMTLLQSLPGDTSAFVSAVSESGLEIVGQSGRSQPYHTLAVRWASNGNVEPITADMIQATAVNADGSAIVGRAVFGTVTAAAIWTSRGGLQQLGSLDGGTGATAYAISGDGSVVVGDGTLVSGGRAFLWTQDTGMVDLNAYLASAGLDVSGWTLQDARGVSHDGRTIAGFGLHNGLQQGWVAVVPSPAAWPVALLAFMLRRTPRPKST